VVPAATMPASPARPEDRVRSARRRFGQRNTARFCESAVLKVAIVKKHWQDEDAFFDPSRPTDERAFTYVYGRGLGYESLNPNLGTSDRNYTVQSAGPKLGWGGRT